MTTDRGEILMRTATRRITPLCSLSVIVSWTRQKFSSGETEMAFPLTNSSTGVAIRGRRAWWQEAKEGWAGPKRKDQFPSSWSLDLRAQKESLRESPLSVQRMGDFEVRSGSLVGWYHTSTEDWKITATVICVCVCLCVHACPCVRMWNVGSKWQATWSHSWMKRETKAFGGTWHFLHQQGQLVCRCLMSSWTTLMRTLNPLSSSFQKEDASLNSSAH